MLKGIPDVISPELLKILDEMGHGDELVIGDANFPSASNAKRLVRSDGNRMTLILDAILKLFPLDIYTDKSVTLIETGNDSAPEIYAEVNGIISKYDDRGEETIDYIDTFKFYERAKNAYAIVASSERKLYGCVIIKKGIIK
ncbi:MAG: RbsD/FucU family protein [Clostridium sp.]|uniref:RbsD/FucU family protein n=1 Tax=Clostridium sp. TaxID=1506 RepID=UPI003D6C7E99